MTILKKYPASVGDMSKNSTMESSVEQDEVFSENSDEYIPQENLPDTNASYHFHDVDDSSTDQLETVRKSTRQKKPTNSDDYMTLEAYDANISLNENLTPEYRMELPEKQNYKDINSTCDIPEISRRCIKNFADAVEKFALSKSEDMYKEKMFQVVEFEDSSIAIIRTDWLTPRKKQTFWPPYKKTADYEKCLTTKESCVIASWDTYVIKKKYYMTDNLIKAKEKLKVAEFESDVNSEAETRKRKRRPNRNFIYSSDDDTEDLQNTVSRKFRFPIPLVSIPITCSSKSHSCDRSVSPFYRTPITELLSTLEWLPSADSEKTVMEGEKEDDKVKRSNKISSRHRRRRKELSETNDTSEVKKDNMEEELEATDTEQEESSDVDRYEDDLEQTDFVLEKDNIMDLKVCYDKKHCTASNLNQLFYKISEQLFESCDIYITPPDDSDGDSKNSSTEDTDNFANKFISKVLENRA
ncbi:hypothetical protein RN001_003518 [Aquatica leii]|uniref:Uncharacterized protein n=1 Tax=Aquatica leii TaxID=1421715 RepID=A0AAN7PIG1_9COLE|nr:hypothetical protein RN001_003518 [Aquatica leii]